MLEIQRIRNSHAEIIEGLKKRHFDATESINEILSKDEMWRSKKSDMESIAAELNKIAKEIGDLFRQGKKDEAEAAKGKTAELKGQEANLKAEVEGLENEIQQLLYTIPNVPNELVVAGRNEQDNEIVFEAGDERKFDFAPQPHWELTKKYDLIDFELGVKITGAGFPVYKGKGAKIQRALINFFLQEAEKAGYEEFIPPHVVNEASGYGTGQLPDKEGQMYHCTEDDLYLIPTAEVPLTNIYRDVVLPNEDFSIKMCGYTPCFRREAGSYGKDVRGLNRLHQFDKVEIVRVEHPENTDKALTEMIDHVKGLLEKLGLQYRILRLCGGDTGFAAAMTYDFEVYSAAQEKWLEVSSVSRFDTFQSNRLKLRFKGADKKTQLAHTLNGSALALPRIVAALLENYQTENTIEMPDCLKPFLAFDKIA
ncbi:MAG: serine--tRNA ligase [Crocinitomicaceae bacterium]|jgi:seryl-tRNA synthetase|nr:serine--tRNA ligase [Crocinitomicaceae bacterium]